MSSIIKHRPSLTAAWIAAPGGEGGHFSQRSVARATTSNFQRRASARVFRDIIAKQANRATRDRWTFLPSSLECVILLCAGVSRAR